MKRINNIRGLFEQVAQPQTKIKITGSVSTPSPQIQVKWNYIYSWPESNQLLGSPNEFVKALSTSTDADIKNVVTQITSSDAAQTAVGIFREPGSTANKRLFAKDQAQTTGSIYLFKAGAIDTSLVPQDKQLEKVANHFTFEVDDSVDTYYKKAVATPTTQPIKPATPKLASYFLSPDGKGYAWFNSTSGGIRESYLEKVSRVIGNETQGVGTSGKISHIFWEFILKLPPADFNIAQPKDKDFFSEDLGAMINKLILMAGAYDKNYSKPSTIKLSKALFNTMVEAWIVICLNSGLITQANIENEIVPEKVKGPIDAATFAAVKGASAQPVSTTSSAVSSTGFDGTTINNEMDLAKVLSGVFVTTYNVAKTDVDSLDKVKAMLNATGKASGWPTPDKSWDETVKSFPWKKGSTSADTSPWFARTQGLIKQDGLYGPKTAAGFLAGFKASAF